MVLCRTLTCSIHICIPYRKNRAATEIQKIFRKFIAVNNWKYLRSALLERKTKRKKKASSRKKKVNEPVKSPRSVPDRSPGDGDKHKRVHGAVEKVSPAPAAVAPAATAAEKGSKQKQTSYAALHEAKKVQRNGIPAGDSYTSPRAEAVQLPSKQKLPLPTLSAHKKSPAGLSSSVLLENNLLEEISILDDQRERFDVPKIDALVQNHPPPRSPTSALSIEIGADGSPEHGCGGVLPVKKRSSIPVPSSIKSSAKPAKRSPLDKRRKEKPVSETQIIKKKERLAFGPCAKDFKQPKSHAQPTHGSPKKGLKGMEMDPMMSDEAPSPPPPERPAEPMGTQYLLPPIYPPNAYQPPGESYLQLFQQNLQGHQKKKKGMNGKHSDVSSHVTPDSYLRLGAPVNGSAAPSRDSYSPSLPLITPGQHQSQGGARDQDFDSYGDASLNSKSSRHSKASNARPQLIQRQHSHLMMHGDTCAPYQDENYDKYPLNEEYYEELEVNFLCLIFMYL